MTVNEMFERSNEIVLWKDRLRLWQFQMCLNGGLCILEFLQGMVWLIDNRLGWAITCLVLSGLQFVVVVLHAIQISKVTHYISSLKGILRVLRDEDE